MYLLFYALQAAAVEVISGMTLKTEIQQSTKPIPVLIIKNLFRSADEVIVHAWYKRICIIAECLIGSKVVSVGKVKKRVSVIE